MGSAARAKRVQSGGWTSVAKRVKHEDKSGSKGQGARGTTTTHIAHGLVAPGPRQVLGLQTRRGGSSAVRSNYCCLRSKKIIPHPSYSRKYLKPCPHHCFQKSGGVPGHAARKPLLLLEIVLSGLVSKKLGAVKPYNSFIPAATKPRNTSGRDCCVVETRGQKNQRHAW